MASKSKKFGVLPNKLIIIKNKDKKFHEKWKKDRDLLDIPLPFRSLIVGPPSCGKSNIIVNLIIKRKKLFPFVCVVHAQPETTIEYDDLQVSQIRDTIPSAQEIETMSENPTDPKLIIIDDLILDKLPKEDQQNLFQLYSYCSTHQNVSIVTTLKDLFTIAPVITKMTNLFVIFKANSKNYLTNIADRINVDPDALKQFFESDCDSHTSFWHDQTTDSPAPYRKDGTIPLVIEYEAGLYGPRKHHL